MSHAPFTEADVDYLLKARKFIDSVMRDTTADPDAPIREIIYRVRRLDRSDDDIKLRLHARRAKPVLTTIPRAVRPSAALLWHGERIRGIDRKIVHSIIRNGLVVGKVRGWHEHQWTNADGDNHVIDANNFMRNVQEDFKSILRFCMERWRIEVKDEDRQLLLGL
jgi:hypothetical protein